MFCVKVNICQFSGVALTGEITMLAVITESNIVVFPVFINQKPNEKGAAY